MDNLDITEWPTAFRVIGFGENAKSAIKHIAVLDYSSVSAEIYHSEVVYTPSENDRMVILLADAISENFKSVAKSFYEAGVLTLGVASTACNIPDDILDSYTILRHDRFLEAVRTLIAPVAEYGPTCYDLNDLRQTLGDMKHFLTATACGRGECRIKDAVNSIAEQLSENNIDSVERLSIFLYFNKESESPVRVEEIAALSEYVNTLPESIETIWGALYDNQLKDGEVKISIIAAGKDLNNG